MSDHEIAETIMLAVIFGLLGAVAVLAIALVVVAIVQVI